MKRGKGLAVFAILCYILAAIMLFKGIDKMVNYSNPDSLVAMARNAYVGGDAYNYIINGTYSTSFFVLAAGFFLTATVSVVGDGIIDAIIWSKETPSVQEKHEENDELPDL